MNLNRIIHTELLKLPRMGNYILLSILIIIDVALSILYFYQFSMSSKVNQSSDFIDLGEQVLNTQSSLAGLLISIFIIMNIGKEYKDGTLRKNIIDGFTRSDFFVGKTIVLVFCVVFAFLIGIISLTIGSVALGHFNDLFGLFSASFFINFFVELFYTALFSLFLIYLFKKTTLSIVFYFVWSIIEGIIVGIQTAYAEFNKITLSIDLKHFLPKTSLEFALQTSQIIEPRAIVVTALYFLILFLLPYYLFTKADIQS